MEFAQLVENPWLWIYLSGLFLGAAGGSLCRVRRRRRSPVTVMSLLAAASLASLSLGFMLVPGLLATQFLLWGFLAALATGALVGLFPLPLFSLFFVVLLLVYSAIGLRFHHLYAWDISTEALNISVLRLYEDGGGSIELRRKGETAVLRFGVDRFLVEGAVYSVSPYIPWPGGALVIPERIVASEGGEVLHVLLPETVSGKASWLSAVSQFISRLPLTGTEEWVSPELKVRLFTGYKITAQDGKIQTVPLSFQ